MATPINLNLVWAASGGITNPGDAKYQAGWVAEIPTFQNFNYVLNALDNNLLAYAENDIYPWQDFLSYTAGARVVRNDITYFCIQPHNDAAGSNPQDPALDTTNSYWVNSVVFSSKADAFTRLDVREGIKLEEVSPQVNANTWTGNDVTVQNKSCITALNTTNASTENLLFGNVGGKLVVVQVGNTVLPDSRDIRPSQNDKSYEIYHQGNKPTQLDVSGTVPENPQDGKLYGRRDGNWVSVSDTTVSTAPPPPVTGAGAGWFNLDDGQFYLDIDDGDSSQWVPANPPIVPALVASGVSYDDSSNGLGSTVQEAITNLSERGAVEQFFMNEQDHEAMREENKQARNYNSGFDEWGNHYQDEDIVNQGINAWRTAFGSTDKDINRVWLGRDSGDGYSKTSYAKTCIAGVVSELLRINGDDARNCSLIQIPAPDGTQTFDSATGESVDYKYDVDPKYWNVAADVNEAIARAFEGDVKNGDFRNGTTSWTGNGATLSATGNELTVTAATTSTCTADQTIAIPTVVGTEYEISGYVVSSDAGEGALIAQGIASMSVPAGEYGTLTFTATGTSTIMRIGIVGSAGQSVVFKNLSFKKATNEVITHPTDLNLFEHWKENDNIEYFPEGSIQTGLTGTWEGFTLVDSIRPASYFQVFDGQYVDGTSVGTAVLRETGATVQLPKCIKLATLTFAESAKLASLVGMGMFQNDDGFIQARYRHRAVRAGNGKWGNFNPITGIKSSNGTSTVLYHSKQPSAGTPVPYSTGVQPQGAKDSAPTTGEVFEGFYQSTLNQTNSAFKPEELHQTGVFVATGVGFSADLNSGYNGECYAQVLGTIPRLNKGAYHPRFNEFGCGQQINAAYDNWVYWYADTAQIPVSISDCFIDHSAGGVSGSDTTGYIGAPVGSGHPDGLFYDAMYASGMNGWIDERLSVTEDSDKATSKRKSDDKNGGTRGREDLVFTFVSTATQGATSTSTAAFDDVIPSKYQGKVKAGDTVHLEDANGNYHERKILTIFGGDSITFDAISTGRKANSKAVFTYETDIEVSDEFGTAMVIGDPANILLTDALKDGWYGTWCPVIPDGTSREFLLNRKAVSVGSTLPRILTQNNGSTWVSDSIAFSEVTNSITSGAPSVTVWITPYTAHTKHTTPTANPVVYRGEDGVEDVFATQYFDAENGCLLQESLIGSVATSSAGAWNSSSKMEVVSILPSSLKLYHGNGFINRHHAVNLPTPDNNSHAVKALFATTVVNGLIYPVYYYTELIYQAGSFVPWGDDSLVRTVDNEGTKTDLNNRTVKVGIAIGKDPIGFEQK